MFGKEGDWMAVWNPWHGCHKISAGCRNCYVYRRDESIGKDASVVVKTSDFDLPIQRDRQHVYRLQPEGGEVYTCMTSDFFLEDADSWRMECWKMIHRRSDLHFTIITKRIHRFLECIPEDWGEGYPNVTICSTCENQDRADYRIPIFLSLPIQHRYLIHEPMLGPIDLRDYLSRGTIERVVCGGESGSNARLCDYDWVLSVREQCRKNGVSFHFKQTGANFRKDGKVYQIPRKLQQPQAAKAAIDYNPEEKEDPPNHDAWLRMDLFQRIQASRFRSSFRLKQKDKEYVRSKGMETIREHANSFLDSRLVPAVIPNDGSQTPMRGHPVFLAQHACACCCRDCLQKWHGIPKGRELTPQEKEKLADILMEWIWRQMNEEHNFLDDLRPET